MFYVHVKRLVGRNGVTLYMLKTILSNRGNEVSVSEKVEILGPIDSSLAPIDCTNFLFCIKGNFSRTNRLTGDSNRLHKLFVLEN